jgi:hypothetical protein
MTQLGWSLRLKALRKLALASLCLSFTLSSVIIPGISSAAAQTGSGAVGIEGTIPSSPPSRGASISVPANGASFSTDPITVSGICPTGLIIKIFDNNVFVGSTICSGGSFSIQIDLFSGTNEITAIDYDSLGQAGPTSNTATVTYVNNQFADYGVHVALSSAYAERGAQPGSELDWPILLSGGTGPYAISVDWGDGSSSELLSQSSVGTINIHHTYSNAGIYNVIVKATDKNGEEAFLQLVGQATGAIQSNNKSSNSSNQIIQKKVIWWPALVLIPLTITAFWLGRKSVE